MNKSAFEDKENFSKPKVSVCIETFNHEKYIAECIEGVLAQKTNFPFEIIIGEDESKDNTRSICEEYARKYPNRIRLFLRSRNDVIYINGTATGRYNLLQNIKAANGKYIAHCAGDDYWVDKLKLQKQVDFLESNSEYGLSIGKAKILKEDTNEIIGKKEYVNPDESQTYTVKDYIQKGPFSVISTFLYLNDGIEYPDWFNGVLGGDQCIAVFKSKNKKIKYHNDVFAIYRLSAGNITKKRKTDKIQADTLYLCDCLNEYTNYKYNRILNLRKHCAKLSGLIVKSKNRLIKYPLVITLLILRKVLRNLP